MPLVRLCLQKIRAALGGHPDLRVRLDTLLRGQNFGAVGRLHGQGGVDVIRDVAGRMRRDWS